MNMLACWLDGQQPCDMEPTPTPTQISIISWRGLTALSNRNASQTWSDRRMGEMFANITGTVKVYNVAQLSDVTIIFDIILRTRYV